MSESGTVALVALVAAVPVAIVLLAAMFRGYDISVTIRRRLNRRKDGEP